MSRRIALSVLTLAIALSSAVVRAEGIPEPGETLPRTDARAVDLSGRPVAIDTILGDAGAAFLFVAASCPASLADADRIAELMTRYRSRGIATTVVEVTARGVAPARPASLSKLTYLVDEGGRLAVTLGVLEVPEVVVLDGSGRIAYRGSAGDPESDLLRDALDAVLERRAPATERTAAVGCKLP
jgi:hypothetical protein